MTSKSWCITIRPKRGVSDILEHHVKVWLSKQPYAHAVVEEKDEARHIHAQIWLDKERYRGEVVRSIKRICEKYIIDWDNAQSKVLSGGVKIAYSDWYESYLLNAEKKKGDELNIIQDRIPDLTEGYYASEEEQNALQKEVNATDKIYYKLEQSFWKWWIKKGNIIKIIGLENIAQYIGDRMYKEKTMIVVQDKRIAQQKCLSLYFYITGKYSMNHFMTKDQIDNWAIKEEYQSWNSRNSE